MDFPKERRWVDGWGTTVELPAVIELLELIKLGSVRAEHVQEELARIGDELDAEYDPEHHDVEAQAYARCFGDCKRCQEAEPEFRREIGRASCREREWMAEDA